MSDTNVKVVQRNKEISNDELKMLQEYYQQTYDKWLDASDMTEEELLEYRVVDKFKIEKTTVDGTVVIGMTYEDKEKHRQTIGEPIILATGSKEEMLDAVFLLLYITKKLDSENEIVPINGSHVDSYFHKRVREFATAQGLR